MNNETNEQSQESSNENATFNLEDAANRKLLATRLLSDIDAYCAAAYNDGPRTHLGASKIAHACSRALWYSFRWVDHAQHSGRKQRLFNRGHATEPRMIEWLRGIGCEVFALDNNGEQYRVTGIAGGHFGGSLDGVNKLPQQYQIAQPFLLEFKTNKTGSDFKKLQKEGVKIAKPVHYGQMCVYGKNYNLPFCLYMCIDKNTDELYIEVVKLDFKHAEQLERKAHIIIHADVPPQKLSESATYQECKNFCDFKEVCHEGKQIMRNCRSCIKSRPVENKEWFCTYHQANIPKQYIPMACDNYEPIV